MHATEFDRTTHRCLDKVGQGLAGQQHGIEISTQLRLNTDLRNDGDFDSLTVVQTHYLLKLWVSGNLDSEAARASSIREASSLRQRRLWVGNCRPWTSGIRTLNLGVRFPAVRSLSLLSLADPQWRGQRCDANAGSAAKGAAVRRRTLNAHCRSPIGHRLVQVLPAPMTGAEGAADLHSAHGNVPAPDIATYPAVATSRGASTRTGWHDRQPLDLHC